MAESTKEGCLAKSVRRKERAEAKDLLPTAALLFSIAH